MRNTVVEPPFIRIWIDVALADAFGVDFVVAVLVTHVLAV
jgi:hypothetical protein